MAKLFAKRVKMDKEILLTGSYHQGGCMQLKAMVRQKGDWGKGEKERTDTLVWPSAGGTSRSFGMNT